MPIIHQILHLLFTCILLTNVSRVISQCTNKNSSTNHVLRNHVIKSMKTADVADCLQQCTKEIRCQSINYYRSGLCELNDKTKETSQTKDFQYDSAGYYMESVNADKHGSSQHKAASSCAEIKRMHPESCSRSYWLDTNRDGNATEQMCFMNSTNYAEVSSCTAMTTSGKCCAFPFVYNSVTYNSCTDVNTNPKRQWCSLKAVYSSDSWEYCVRHVQCPKCSTKDGHCCVFPFEYRDKKFDSCTTYWESSGKYWCSRTENYEGSWDYCGKKSTSHKT